MLVTHSTPSWLLLLLLLLLAAFFLSEALEAEQHVLQEPAHVLRLAARVTVPRPVARPASRRQ